MPKYIKYNGRLYRRAWVDQQKTADLLSTWWLRDNEVYRGMIPKEDAAAIEFLKKKFKDFLDEQVDDILEDKIDWMAELPKLRGESE